MKKNILYCCTKSECKHVSLREQNDGLHCPNGHFFPYIHGTRAPVFACEDENANDYALEHAAAIHDNSLRWVFDTFETDEVTLRKNLISQLQLFKGETILITGAGAGNDIPFLLESLSGEGTIYAQDISKQMLMAGIERYGSLTNNTNVNLYFSASDATNLPFEKNTFDAAYHFGGLNLFTDIRKGILEMDRVVKPGGRVVISDEGVAPWLKQTTLGKMLIKNNPLYDYEAPLTFLPSNARSVNLSWELSNCFYVIKFIVSDTQPNININIPHVGKRGGSIKTRYLGQLEGIDPSLRDKVYAEAEQLGISRVEYLERLIRSNFASLSERK